MGAKKKVQPVTAAEAPFIPEPVIPAPKPSKPAGIGHDELLSSHDQDIMSIRKDMKELQGDLGRIVKLLAQVLGGDFATEANTILTKRQEVS